MATLPLPAKPPVPQSVTGGMAPGAKIPPGAPSLTPPAAPGAGGPLSAPMNTPEPMKGLQANGRVQVIQAMDMLTQALPSLGIMSEEGQAVNSALKSLANVFGKSEAKSRELMPAEILGLLGALPQAQRPTPGQASMMKPPPGAGGPLLPQ